MHLLYKDFVNELKYRKIPVLFFKLPVVLGTQFDPYHILRNRKKQIEVLRQLDLCALIGVIGQDHILVL